MCVHACVKLITEIAILVMIQFVLEHSTYSTGSLYFVRLVFYQPTRFTCLFFFFVGLV